MYNELLEMNVSLFSGVYDFDCGSDAAIIRIGDHCGFFLDIDKIRTIKQEKMAVVHEWSHLVTGTTYKIDATPRYVQWCEAKAHRAEIKKLLPFEELKQAVISGINTPAVIAEHFNVPESLVSDAFHYYIEEKGLSFDEC